MYWRVIQKRVDYLDFTHSESFISLVYFDKIKLKIFFYKSESFAEDFKSMTQN